MIDFTKVFKKEPEMVPIDLDWKLPEHIDRGVKEILWFSVDGGQIYTSHVETFDPNDDEVERWGPLSFEEFYGDLSWSIETTLGSEFPKFGYFMMGGADIHYSEDYWGEVDVDFDPGEIRPTTLKEIREQFGDKITIRVFLDQLKACWIAARYMEKF